MTLTPLEATTHQHRYGGRTFISFQDLLIIGINRNNDAGSDNDASISDEDYSSDHDSAFSTETMEDQPDLLGDRINRPISKVGDAENVVVQVVKAEHAGNNVASQTPTLATLPTNICSWEP